MKRLRTARIDQLADSNEPAIILKPDQHSKNNNAQIFPGKGKFSFDSQKKFKQLPGKNVVVQNKVQSKTLQNSSNGKTPVDDDRRIVESQKESSMSNNQPIDFALGDETGDGLQMLVDPHEHSKNNNAQIFPGKGKFSFDSQKKFKQLPGKNVVVQNKVQSKTLQNSSNGKTPVDDDRRIVESQKLHFDSLKWENRGTSVINAWREMSHANRLL